MQLIGCGDDYRELSDSFLAAVHSEVRIRREAKSGNGDFVAQLAQYLAFFPKESGFRPKKSGRIGVDSLGEVTNDERFTCTDLRYPTKRFAHVRAPNLKPIRELLLVSMDISNFRFSKEARMNARA